MVRYNHPARNRIFVNCAALNAILTFAARSTHWFRDARRCFCRLPLLHYLDSAYGTDILLSSKEGF